MKLHLAFNESRDEKFVVLCSVGSGPTKSPASISVFLFENENSFLEGAVAADLSYEDLISLTATVLLSISQPIFPQRWVVIDATSAQRLALGLLPATEEQSPAPLALNDAKFPVWSFQSIRQLNDFLMQAPTPFMMLHGPEHVVTFINPPCLQLFGMEPGQCLLGLTIRKLLPELKGQPLYGLLDQVYRTGVPYIGQEALGRLLNQSTGKMEDRYFDFIYHPTHDNSGAVFGIFVQASDVTERVLARHVSQSREMKLYRQWAELDTMYRTAPVGMCLVDCEEYRILRINNKMASLTREQEKGLIGHRILEVFPGVSGMEQQLLKAASGDYVRNFEATTSVRALPGVLRQWLLSFGPLRDASGEVEAIACVSLEVTDLISGYAADRPGDCLEDASSPMFS